MTDSEGSKVTQILRAGAGDDARLLPLVYAELQRIAQSKMRDERTGHTLQATALVHEAYMRLVGDEPVAWEGRRHFYAAASEAMRRILIDHARRVRSLKRGGDKQRVTLGAPEAEVELDPDQLLALDEAIDKLEQEDPRAAAVTRLRFLSGLTVEETAQTLGCSVRSVHREWTFARARLTQILGE
jgi:RNA polymerase sigma factor (TIGR02999 family)